MATIAVSATKPNWWFINKNLKNFVVPPRKSSISTTSTQWVNSKEKYSLEQLRSNKRKLETIKHLKANWNQYGAQEFDNTLISKVMEILPKLEFQPQIFPTARGTIQIEKYLNKNNFIEVEISNEEIFAYMVKNGKETEKEITINEINTLLTDLYA